MSILKKCFNPECGSTDIKIEKGYTFGLNVYIKCNKCGVRGPIVDSFKYKIIKKKSLLIKKTILNTIQKWNNILR